MNLSELLELRDKLVKDLEAIAANAAKEKRENGLLNADEIKRSSEIEAEIASVDANIKAVQAKRAIIASTPPAQEPDARRVDVVTKKEENPFANFGENLQAIRALQSPSTDARSREQALNRMNASARAQGLNEAIPSEGGFAIHPEFAAGIQQRSFEVGKLLGLVDKVTLTQGNQLVMTALKDDSRANGSRLGGVAAAWKNEAATLSSSKLGLEQRKIDLQKLTAAGYASDESLEDAPLLASILLKAFADEIAFQLDEAILRGDGVTQPRGLLLTGGAKIAVAKESGQAAASIVFENIIKMYARSTQGPRLAWFGNQDILPSLCKMSLAVGTGGAPVWLPAGGATAQPYQTLMGYPLYYIEHAETLGTEGDLMLLDLDQYLLATKGGMKSDSSMHVSFLTGEQVFKLTMRVGGQPKVDKVITPYKGSNTISPIVTLAVRA